MSSQKVVLVTGAAGGIGRAITVRDVMTTDLVTVEASTPTLDALELMRDKGIGALPVVVDGKLVGIVTAYDLLTVSSKLVEERLKQIL